LTLHLRLLFLTWHSPWWTCWSARALLWPSGGAMPWCLLLCVCFYYTTGHNTADRLICSSFALALW
jgi:hypothetical protein